ncbi:ABC transporter substrate-binding protein [Frankia sp. Mgl5]|uniref:ABC transporter substrate-binding protein n=1 Tax=Frankia sp. Mgl5 TaxID=2933793 RepID=UPI00201096E2|nr:ABC transporter substrate-binding protein [Frankia sp. Mgl5]MCK9930508.1 ABC transporter substrate-binding protein [Frankia sp. Mgl5]
MRLPGKRSCVIVGLGLSIVFAATTACGSGSDETTGEVTATGAPIKVGFFKPAAGVGSLPGAIAGMEGAVAYVNSELHGIDGRPIEVEDCSVDGTPETTISCANKFVQDGVVAAFDGFNYSSSAGIDTLVAARIPLVGQIPFDQTTGSKAEGRVFFAAPQASFLVGALQGFKSEGMTSVTLALQDTPSGHNTVDNQLKPLSAALGLKATGVYFSPTNPNFSAVASTVASTNPDVAGLIASPNESVCVQLVKNLRSTGYKGAVFLAACTAFIKAAPESAPGATMYSSIWLPGSEKNAPAEVGRQMALATKYIGEAGGPADYYAYGQFATVVDFARGLATAPPTENLTGASVLTTLKSLKDFPTFLGPNVTCGKATTPNCTTQMLLFSVQKDLTLKPVSGDWITPAPQILSTIPGAS